MTEIPSRDSQLDRVEQKLDQVLDRLTRMEERQNSHAGKLDSHQARLDEHATRLRDVELHHAVVAATGQEKARVLNGRWAAVGAAALVLLGSIGAFIGNAVITIVRALTA